MARVATVGVPHHLTQRGNNRQSTFFDDDDRLAYCRLLDEQCSREGVRLLGYCLMSNHVHLAAIPERPESLARGLGRAHYLYTRALHQRRRTSGHLWQNVIYHNRFKKSGKVGESRGKSGTGNDFPGHW